ncbi:MULTISPECIES: flagellar assembly protein FliW [Dethiosulfovibrio]|jgi:flagellar assembly factor FliW|uniref:Flagellar assembly factor FliW n=2 Tax=Dethiosulfovibrio TaxID=47054 RepID=A0ABS9ELE7_9BACT|nr:MULTISPECIES: flagellar assembly protein FliW [Dethiosulfovibrio]MCF4113055.1 flagellar assembly protein FliW [Dethiosulfovibrio russensis]MCF4141519.1 flagellar assembly protein FliW [Dethiosulfovibrio marinus]MCF4144475.1 flagellar assembly protein FliW [Dethiosulfovibrio acidaminovorans]
MKKLASSRVKDVSYEEKDLFFFPKGIPGFEHLHEWLIVGDEDSPVKWLHSVEEDVALPIAHPRSFFIDYDANISKSVLADLGTEKLEKLTVVVVLSLSRGDVHDSTVNLKAPILINGEKRLGMQVIALNEDYDVRHPLFSPSTKE